tara:strand:+ start:418 stop:894 length:477 start_codon:yes stop_codon:yes gene_type:complete
MKIKNFKKEIIVLIIIILLFTFLVLFRYKLRENFKDVLENVDLMEDKLGSLVDQEVETRTFCKLLRHDSNIKQPMNKILEQRNIQFNNNWKKQNRLLSDIKKKIIEMKLGDNNSKFAEFNTERNRKTLGNINRKKLMENAKSMIRKKPEINFTVDNNI